MLIFKTQKSFELDPSEHKKLYYSEYFFNFFFEISPPHWGLSHLYSLKIELKFLQYFNCFVHEFSFFRIFSEFWNFQNGYFDENLSNFAWKFVYWKASEKATVAKKVYPPRRGIEPRSPAWQAGILTTILPRMSNCGKSL